MDDDNVSPGGAPNASRSDSDKRPLIYKEETEKVPFYVHVENNIEVIVDPKLHIPHFLLFLVCAGCTIAYTITSLKVDRGVILTNFKMLRPLDLTAPAAETHAALASRWKCPPLNVTAGAVARADPWGPDSMCRCIAKQTTSACASLAACATVENVCYANVVPVYAHVYAGLDVSGFNIVIAFFLIHMAVLLNMAAETARDMKDEKDTKQETPKIVTGAVVQNTKEGETALERIVNGGEGFNFGEGKVQYGTANQMIMGRFVTFGTGWQDKTTYEQEQQKKRELEDTETRKKIQKKEQYDSNRVEYLTPMEEHQTTLSQTYAFKVSKFVKDRTTQLALFVLLTITSFIFAIMRLSKVPNGSESQKCDMTNSCMTQDLLSSVTMILLVLDLLLCFLAVATWTSTKAKEHSEFAISTYEDMHNIVAFMLLAASFGALSGVHDDTTLLMDVLTIMVIGFLQGVQHNTILAKEIFIEHCEKTAEDGTVGMLKDGMGNEHYVCTTILSFFLYTRLFIFVLITGCSFFFYMRLASSVGTGETTGNWYAYMRFLASLVGLTPSFFGDVAYEVRHAATLKVSGTHLKYSGAHLWRRTIYLLYVIFFAVLSWKTYAVEVTA